MTLIKCCGMSRPRDIEAVNAARPDFCGFVVDFPKSHRSVSANRARELRLMLDPGIAAVGVFVDAPAQQVARLAKECGFDAVQLHGHETQRDIAAIRELSGIVVIQAFKVRSADDLEAARRSSADHVLLDNGQGTGAAFDWSLLAGFERPYFLAGGLTPDNIPEAIRRLAPYALDISSGIETDGAKDPEKIARAVSATRTASERPSNDNQTRRFA